MAVLNLSYLEPFSLQSAELVIYTLSIAFTWAFHCRTSDIQPRWTREKVDEAEGHKNHLWTLAVCLQRLRALAGGNFNAIGGSGNSATLASYTPVECSDGTSTWKRDDQSQDNV